MMMAPCCDEMMSVYTIISMPMSICCLDHLDDAARANYKALMIQMTKEQHTQYARRHQGMMTIATNHQPPCYCIAAMRSGGGGRICVV